MSGPDVPTVHVVRSGRQITGLLSRVRHALGLSQQELGSRIGTTQSAVSEWETGGCRMSVESVLKTADALGYDVVLVRREEVGS